MHRHLRPALMAAYTPSFIWFSVASIRHEPESLPPAYVAWQWLFLGLCVAGNVLFAVRHEPSSIKALWKAVFPLLVAGILIDGFIGSGSPGNTEMTPAEKAIIWLLVLGLFSPTLVAAFLLGYGQPPDDSITAGVDPLQEMSAGRVRGWAFVLTGGWFASYFGIQLAQAFSSTPGMQAPLPWWWGAGGVLVGGGLMAKGLRLRRQHPRRG